LIDNKDNKENKDNKIDSKTNLIKKSAKKKNEKSI
jgi:hypothetical protein